MLFYTYAYLREDGTPYYVGKGSGNRIHHSRHNVQLPPRDRRIYLKQHLTEDEAFKHEIYMIAVYGRKDVGTGILRNFADGGVGGATGYVHDVHERRKRSDRMINNKIWEGRKHTQDAKDKVSKARKGKKLTDKHVSKLKSSHSKILWRVTNPQGATIELYNLTSFCRENNLNPSAFYNYGKHKGWKAHKCAS